MAGAGVERAVPMHPPKALLLVPLAAATVLSACGGTSGAPGGGGGSSGGGALSFGVRTADFGSTTYPCSAGSGITTFSGFMVSCEPNDPSGVAQPIIGVAGYHGTDSYSFGGSNDIAASFVQFGLANHDFRSAPASPGIPGTTCTVQLVGPPTLSQGDHVSGSFHCENIHGDVVHGDGGYQPPVWTSADGEFDGYVLM
jgi:hypothetical protein